MSLSIYLCTQVEENVCLSYMPISEIMSFQDAAALLTAIVGIFALAYTFRLLFRLFNI